MGSDLPRPYLAFQHNTDYYRDFRWLRINNRRYCGVLRRVNKRLNKSANPKSSEFNWVSKLICLIMKRHLYYTEGEKNKRGGKQNSFDQPFKYFCILADVQTSCPPAAAILRSCFNQWWDCESGTFNCQHLSLKISSMKLCGAENSAQSILSVGDIFITMFDIIMHYFMSGLWTMALFSPG